MESNAFSCLLSPSSLLPIALGDSTRDDRQACVRGGSGGSGVFPLPVSLLLDRNDPVALTEGGTACTGDWPHGKGRTRKIKNRNKTKRRRHPEFVTARANARVRHDTTRVARVTLPGWSPPTVTRLPLPRRQWPPRRRRQKGTAEATAVTWSAPCESRNTPQISPWRVMAAAGAAAAQQTSCCR